MTLPPVESLSLQLRVAHRTNTVTARVDGILVGYVHDSSWVTFECGAGIPVGVGNRVPLVGSLAGQAFRTGQTLYCEDTEIDPRVDLNFSRAMQVRSLLCVPLRRGNQVAGVLCLFSIDPSAFDDRFVSSFKTLGYLD